MCCSRESHEGRLLCLHDIPWIFPPHGDIVPDEMKPQTSLGPTAHLNRFTYRILAVLSRSGWRAVGQLGMGVGVVALFLLLFWPTWVVMAEQFAAPNSLYSHGWLIPLASAWLVWQRRERLARCPIRPSYRGLALLLPALLLHLVAMWWRVQVVSSVAVLGVLAGVIWTFWGRQVLWAVRMPVVFLLFMIPLPSFFLAEISFKMKLLAAGLATHLVQGLGIAAQQAGSVIRVPGMSIIIDEMCSGLRSLISLLALAALWTSLMPSSSWWKKLAVLMAAFPIAVVANMVRILLVVWMAIAWGAEAATGFLHHGSGLVVFGVALAALVWLHRVFTRNTLTSPQPS